MFGGITVSDKNAFVESVIAKGRSLDEIVKEALDEIRETESRSPLITGAPANRAVGSSDHVRFLRILVFFLQGGVIPENLSDDEFQILLPLAQHLVDRGDLKPGILKLFGE